MTKRAKPGYSAVKIDWTPERLWSLDGTLCGVIASAVRAFRKNHLAGHPTDLTAEQWQAILKKIEKGYQHLWD